MRAMRQLLPWLIGLVIIPLAIAAIGYNALERAKAIHQSTGAPPTATSGASTLSLAPFSIVRKGNDVTLSGDFPDVSAKAALMKALNGALPPGVNIVDQIRINPDIDALDFSKAEPVFRDSASMTDFTLRVNEDTVTVAGTAASAQQKNSVDSDAKRIWSNLKIVDNIADNATAAPPPPAASGPCSDLQSTITAATDGKVTFDRNGFTLSLADEQVLAQVADKLKACPTPRVTINGYADNTGNEAINIPLSEQRAQAVADFLVAQGVTRDRLSSAGLGSADPAAPNGTAEGRAANRRVEIVVS